MTATVLHLPARACESCGQRPASVSVAEPDAEPFAVCTDCAPPTAPVTFAESGDALPWDWSGTVVLEPDWPAVVAWALTCAGLVSVALLGGLVFGSQEAFVASGVVAAVALVVAMRVRMALTELRRSLADSGGRNRRRAVRSSASVALGAAGWTA
ncbi:hypothetical protein [Kineosporia sp. A_224]|uniref:hypothetical protein n=1 Tax=Kineosporia sp. A_224 TaxID=1962180 RepID=UPI00117B11B1|nr:hypothetical protein [Kineosporia sp. A_224]